MTLLRVLCITRHCGRYRDDEAYLSKVASRVARLKALCHDNDVNFYLEVWSARQLCAPYVPPCGVSSSGCASRVATCAPCCEMQGTWHATCPCHIRRAHTKNDVHFKLQGVTIHIIGNQ